MKPLIILTAGHHATDSGATSLIWGNENINTQLLRNTILFYLKRADVDVFYDLDTWTLSQVIQRAKIAARGRENVLALDIHFNSFHTHQANGTEIIIDDHASDLTESIARELLDISVDVFKLKDRGIKRERQTARKRLGFLDITEHSFVDEVAFLSNDDDMRAVINNYWVWAERRAKYLINWCNDNIL